jgi:DNA adenine methylase
MRYPGGKNSGGAYQTVINQIPPHNIYIEPFLGSGAVARFKRGARVSHLIDVDPETVDAFNRECRRLQLDLTARPGCGIDFLESYQVLGDEFIYVDPPYLVSATLQRRPVYLHSLTEKDHIRLLGILKTITAPVAIAGYASSLYAKELAGWRQICYPAMTRGGRMATECVWMNFPEAVALHDYRYLGANRTERQRIKRKRQRWEARLERMPILERQALLAALQGSQIYLPPSADADISGYARDEGSPGHRIPFLSTSAAWRSPAVGSGCQGS